MGMENWDNDNDKGKAEVLTEKSDQFLFCQL